MLCLWTLAGFRTKLPADIFRNSPAIMHHLDGLTRVDLGKDVARLRGIWVGNCREAWVPLNFFRVLYRHNKSQPRDSGPSTRICVYKRGLSISMLCKGPAYISCPNAYIWKLEVYFRSSWKFRFPMDQAFLGLYWCACIWRPMAFLESEESSAPCQWYASHVRGEIMLQRFKVPLVHFVVRV
ncbi:hypothetical protein BT96DRAFT_310606 [Gymnopus androsaceus JB14]|uniref:Uncharacterized protein n=1 Tax=Gymnopus androsaceus JB14 TaxID=1447944 RepID=A0A6A4H0V9_9AGAR|nr:hypothetical protein BT96DRAFT_310606 [Gymnopus androsaceus JB14]